MIVTVKVEVCVCAREICIFFFLSNFEALIIQQFLFSLPPGNENELYIKVTVNLRYTVYCRQGGY